MEIPVETTQLSSYPSVNHAVGLAFTFKYLNQLPLKLRMHGLRQPQSGRIRSRAMCSSDAFRKSGVVKRGEGYDQNCSDKWRSRFYIFFQRFAAGSRRKESLQMWMRRCERHRRE
jgi:hypothetical protein